MTTILLPKYLIEAMLSNKLNHIIWVLLVYFVITISISLLSTLYSNYNRISSEKIYLNIINEFLNKGICLDLCFFDKSYPQFTRNYTPQNGIISSFSALSSISVLPVRFLRLPWKWRNTLRLRSPESESIKSASCKALKRHVPGVHGIKATQQDADFMPSDRVVPCKLRI